METERKDANNFYKILALIAFLVVVGTCGYLVYSQYQENHKKVEDKTTSTKKEEPEKVEEQGTSVDVSNNEVTTIHKQLSTAFSNSITSGPYFGYLYTKDKITTSDFNDKLFSFVGLSVYSNEHQIFDETNVSASDVQKYVNDIFGSITYNDQSPRISEEQNGKGLFAYGAVYNSNTRQYLYNPNGGGLAPMVAFKVTKGLKYSDRIELFEKHIVWAPTDSGFGYYKDYDAQNFKGIGELGSTNDNYDQISQGIQTYENQLTEYKYTFNKDENGEYHFASIEKVN